MTRYDYEWLFGAVRWIRAPNGTTEFKYDHGRCAAPQYNGNPIRIERPRQRLPGGAYLAVVDELDYAPGGILKYLKDPDGVEHDWVIDVAGRVKQHTAGGQLVESFTYDDKGNIKTRTDGRGKTWEYDWDDRDLSRTVTDPLGHITTVAHNLNDWQTASWTDRIDDPTTIPGMQPQPALRVYEMYAYDLLGNRTTHTQHAVSGTGSVSRTWRWTLDAEERLSLLESPRATSGGRTDARVRTTYNARGLVRNTVSADGGSEPGTTRTYYDEDGRVALVRDELGRRTVTRYDRFGRPEAEERPNGTIRHLEYRGARLWREWFEGPISSRPVGLGGTPVTRVLSEVRFQVDAWQRPITRTTKVFDPRLRPSIGSTAGSDWTEKTWLTAAGRLHRQQDPAGHEAVFKWNTQGRLDTLTMPGGHTVGYRYEGELVRSITTTLKPDAGVTGPLPPADLVLVENHKYDDLGRLIRHENAYGVVVEHAYDSMNNLRAKRSPILQGQHVLTQMVYDPLGRLVNQTTDSIASASNPDATMGLVFGYDLNDNLTQLTDDLGRVTEASFDGRDLQRTLQQPQQRDITFRRRRNGVVWRIERSGGATTTLAYTPTDQVASVTHTGGGGATVRQVFGYDGLDRMLWATDSNGGAQFRVQSYRGIDSLGRVLREQTVIPEYNYDEAVGYDYAQGRRRMEYPDGVRVTHTIGGDGNAKQIELSGHGVVLDALHQGPGRVLQQQRNLRLRASQPTARRWDLVLRTSQRHDAFGRLNFRALHITDTINRPTQPGFLPLGTQAERTSYEANGMPRTRNFGVMTQPGVSVDSTFVYDGLGRARVITEGEGQDFVNFDYDWDGAGQLHLFEINGRQGGQIINESTTMAYQAGQRTDQRRVNGVLQSTTTWRFDTDGRLTESDDTQSGVRREVAYDAANRVRQVDVFTAGLIFTGQETSQFLYDAFGRIVARVAASEPEFFAFDGSSLIAELDAQRQLARRYVYDERRQLVHYGYRDPNGSWRTVLPLLTAEGTPWVLLDDRPTISQLPTPPGAAAAAPTRANYYRQEIPLILEENRWRPFEKGQVIRYDYSGGSASGTLVDASLLPIDTGGRRFFAQERLFANGPRFYDPALRAFIVPDGLGAWGHPMAFGNPYSYAGNNPVVFGDDGNHPAVVGVLIVVGIGVLIGAGLNIARQGIQLAEGSRENFSWTELGFSALLGGVLAPAFVFAPELAVPAALVGLGFSTYQYSTGQIGGYTYAFDVATLAVPFGFKGVRAATFGKGTMYGQARGLGPAASLSERAGRFAMIGQTAIARMSRAQPTEELVTLQRLRELGARDTEPPVPQEVIDSLKGRYIDKGRQGEVFELVGAKEPLVIKEFFDPHGAAKNLGDIEMLHLAMMRLRGQLGPHRIRIPRIHAIGRTSNGRSFMIRERVIGDFKAARTAMEGPGVRTLSRAVFLMEAVDPPLPLPMEGNVIMTPDGTLVVFDL